MHLDLFHVANRKAHCLYYKKTTRQCHKCLVHDNDTCSTAAARGNEAGSSSAVDRSDDRSGGGGGGGGITPNCGRYVPWQSEKMARAPERVPVERENGGLRNELESF